MKKISDLFSQKTQRVSDNETFVNLIRVARESGEIREELGSILALDDFNRKSALNTLIERLRYKQAPEAFISALETLLDDDVAAKALELIRSPPS
jgi:hypothetical protein